jgi:hypothetical protein
MKCRAPAPTINTRLAWAKSERENIGYRNSGRIGIYVTTIFVAAMRPDEDAIGALQ